MEVELESKAFLEEESLFDVAGGTDGGLFENERCGICLDVIVDRGVLDCCQHWFCFVCIDNWATITNLCPLCENEFQLITCVPVYDTIGSSKADDEPLVREEDWFVQGRNNTLSFPSYYIDENAVICLDGDGCKIRNAAALAIEDPDVDTSIACDSCDIWYHAFCVGFDPGNTYENSWLCPRCAIDGVPGQASKVQSDGETASRECLLGANFSGKFSVSVADAGETAVVVSVFQGQQCNDERSENFTSALDNEDVEKKETFLSNSSGFTIAQLNQNTDHRSTLDTQDASLALSLSSDVVPCISLPLEELKATSADEAFSCPNVPHGSKICDLTNKINTDNGTADGRFRIKQQMGFSTGSSLSVDMINSDATKNHLPAISEQIEDSLSVDKMALGASGETTGFLGSKRKSTSPKISLLFYFVLFAGVTAPPGIETLPTECQTENPAKKARSDGIEPAGFDTSDDDLLEDEDVDEDVDEDEDEDDIMSLVRGTCTWPATGLSRLGTADKSSQANDNGTRLRVKKIMRRGTEDESAKLVEKLREEIKEAVRNKSAKDIGKSNLFDPKLLAAFRAAVAGPRTEQLPIKRLNPMVVRSKKTLLQKGKIRENLTKKIYGNNGKRRRAWDRDWEVEFWKHRCNNSARPEKVETLKSVLDLLTKNSESLEMEEVNPDDGTTILSRLYLADASVFPRKDDIKPLSAISGHNNHELDKEHNLNHKTCGPVSDKSTTQTPAKSNQSCSQAYNASNSNASSLKNDAALRKVNKNVSARKQTLTSMPKGSKVNAHSNKEAPGKSDVKSDKRKWALEVLARKNATAGMNSTKEKQEDDVMLKGSFPLLAQLPKDLRPVLQPSRHNKVPISVRQTQLYRLTEHFLRKANVPVIRRTADTELAVADATNIEKGIADKSNSKLVYVNLCSQVVSQNASKCKQSGDAKSSHYAPASSSAAQEPHLDAPGEEALRMAGLVDSPPSSPCHKANGTNDDDEPSSIASGGEGPDNVFDMDNHPELDIYGDFEYDLDDECVDTGVLRLSKSQPEETDNKMKVVFSTLNATKVNSEPIESKDHEVLQIIESPTKPFSDTALEVRTNASSPAAEPLEGETGEPSLAECEELYGPDKEPLAVRFPDKIPGDTDLLAERVPSAENGACGENAAAMEMQAESFAENVFVNGRLPADHESGGETSPNHSLTKKNNHGKEKKTSNSKQCDISHSISKKVEAYVKEHIRPLCKSGVITPEQYRWAVGKTTEKVMRFHFKDKNANFLIKEGEKVKKLAEQYVEASQQKQSKLP
ncbi:hypothetical protein Sjap_005436 [Stephania japonica]|uniref:RING-type domain-containing protein n=1 Tax=Stephania japonica TaxID=461633 RepID=A0AAP0K5K9_9MAGN